MYMIASHGNGKLVADIHTSTPPNRVPFFSRFFGLPPLSFASRRITSYSIYGAGDQHVELAFAPFHTDPGVGLKCIVGQRTRTMYLEERGASVTIVEN